MDLCRHFQSFSSCRELFKQASNRTGGWTRWLFGHPLVRLVSQVKEDYRGTFESLLLDDGRLLQNLELGHHRPLRAVVGELDFSNPSQTVAGLAYLVHILERWDQNTSLSSGYTLDTLSLELWKHALREGILKSLPGQAALGSGRRARVSPELVERVEASSRSLMASTPGWSRSSERLAAAAATLPLSEAAGGWPERAGLDPEEEEGAVAMGEPAPTATLAGGASGGK